MMSRILLASAAVMAVAGAAAGQSQDNDPIQDAEAPQCSVANDEASPDTIDTRTSGLIRLRTEQLAHALVTRGRAFEGLGKHDRALADYNRATALKPDYEEAFNVRANTYAREEQYDRAIADYDQAIKLNDKDAEAFNSRGNAYFFTGQYDQAIADYDRAFEDYDQAIRPLSFVLRRPASPDRSLLLTGSVTTLL
jgi:tetratricopeptide (TPR) repeat protein